MELLSLQRGDLEILGRVRHGQGEPQGAQGQKAGDGDKAAKKEYSSLLTNHADSHMDQMLYNGGALDIATSSIIVDPMHALQLNAGKVVWKWTIGMADQTATSDSLGSVQPAPPTRSWHKHASCLR